MSLYAAKEFAWGFPGWVEGRTEQWIRFLVSMMPEYDDMPKTNDFESKERYVEALYVSGKRKELRGDLKSAFQFYHTALQLDTSNSILALSLGLTEVYLGDFSNGLMEELSLHGIQLLESVISPKSMFRPIPSPIVKYGIQYRAAFYYSQRHYHKETSSNLLHLAASTFPHDDCWEIYHASYVGIEMEIGSVS